MLLDEGFLNLLGNLPGNRLAKLYARRVEREEQQSNQDVERNRDKLMAK
jgi:hypothetical protein